MSWCYKWWTEQHNINVAGFNKNVIFYSNLDFYLSECTEAWKSIFVAEKQYFLLKMSNSDGMLLCWSFMASGIHVDESDQNQSLPLKFWENLDFEQFLKMSFAPHISCHECDLSNITNWQHVGERPLWQRIGNKSLPPHVPEVNYHLWRRFFFTFR